MLALFPCRSKTETKEATFKSIALVPGVTISAPVFSAAKPASVFAGAEPDGYIISVTESGKPSLDLKVRLCSHENVVGFVFAKKSDAFGIGAAYAFTDFIQ